MQFINDVYTPKKHRNKGYATKLCSYLAWKILKENEKKPVLTVFTNNLSAINIYEKIGFEKIAKVTLCLKE